MSMKECCVHVEITLVRGVLHYCKQCQRVVLHYQTLKAILKPVIFRFSVINSPDWLIQLLKSIRAQATLLKLLSKNLIKISLHYYTTVIIRVCFGLLTRKY